MPWLETEHLLQLKIMLPASDTVKNVHTSNMFDTHTLSALHDPTQVHCFDILSSPYSFSSQCLLKDPKVNLESDEHQPVYTSV